MKPSEDKDDGHTISNMDIEGMPWHTEKRGEQPEHPMPLNELTPKEHRAFLRGVLGAALLVALVFALAYFLLIWFMDAIWFR